MSTVAAAFRLAFLELQTRRRRIVALLAFAALFVVAAATAAALGRSDGHVEMDTLYRLGGYPLISGILLTGWLLGRFPLVATLVLLSGVISDDDRTGQRRLLAARPVSPALLYGARLLVLGGVAFALSAVLMPLFDLIMLGTWGGSATLVLILAHVVVWASLTALFSVFTHLDAWLTLLLALLAMVWAALANADMIPVAGILSDLIVFVLPPQSQLFALEAAFAQVEPIPWDALAFCLGYAAVALALAALLMRRKEL